jgi:hypothetical protein
MADIARDKALQHGATASAAPRRTEAASPKGDELSAHRAKTRSWDYIWRTGVAGGLAGCAVSCWSQTANIRCEVENIALLTPSMTGKNDSGAP